MASSSGTYKVQDAIDIVKSTTTTRGMENMHTAADLALRYMWMEYPWRETLSQLVPFVLVPGLQDYGRPWSVVPEDFGSLWKVYITYAPADGQGARRIELDIKNEVFFENYYGSIWPPEAVMHVQSSNAFRFSACTPANVGGPEYFVEGEYKIRPTKITAANAGSMTFPMSDDHFPAFIEAIRWWVWRLQGDPRAGAIQVFGTGQRQYSGQAAVVHDLLVQLIEAETEGRGTDQLSPDASLTEW